MSLASPSSAARAIQLWHGQTEAGEWEGDAAESGGAQAAVLGSRESRCATVRSKEESRNVTSSREHFI